MEYFFFYGTLRSTIHPPAEVIPILSQIRFVGSGFIHGRLFDFGDYPGLIVDQASETRVIGEVFAAEDASLLAGLDAYEEFDPDDLPHSPFVRIRYPVTLFDGPQLTCWLYVYNRDPESAPVIEGGDYAAWRAVGKGLNSGA